MGSVHVVLDDELETWLRRMGPKKGEFSWLVNVALRHVQQMHGQLLPMVLQAKREEKEKQKVEEG